MRIGLAALRAIQRPLFESAASLDRQLAALRQWCSGGRLPTTAQLQVAWAALAIELAPVGVTKAGLPQAELLALNERAARTLLDLQPDNPRSSYELGKAAFYNSQTGSASRLHESLPHFRRGAELARAQGSDFWLAR